MLADWINKLDKREQAGLVLVSVVLTILVIDQVVVLPIRDRCAWLDRDIALERKTQELHASWLQRKPAVEKEFGTIQGRLGPILAPSEVIDAMKGEIDALARASDVILLAVKHREPRQTEFYDEYAIDGDFESDEIGLVRFLHTLVTTPGTFRVTRLKIAPDNTGKRIKGSMTITKVAMPTAPGAPPKPEI